MLIRVGIIFKKIGFGLDRTGLIRLLMRKSGGLLFLLFSFPYVNGEIACISE
jgi:hypothetical protein